MQGVHFFASHPGRSCLPAFARRAFDALIQCQELHMKKILRELDSGAKESCWAWYIFPTEKAGMCDFDGTRITKENAVDLCNNGSTASDWRKCLEKICDLLEVRMCMGGRAGNQS